MRWNCPPMAAASDLTESVLASPGTPSTSRCPPESSAIAIRSSSTSWPTMIRLTSKSTGCSGLGLSADGWVMGLLGAGLVPVRRSYLGSYPWPLAAGAAECGTDGHREPDAGERVLAIGGGDRDDDADDQTMCVEQRAARAAWVNRRVELDKPGELAVVGVRGPVEPGDHPGGHAVGQAERIADSDDGRAHIGSSAERGRHDDLRQLRRGGRGDVRLRVGGGDSRVRRAAVGERDGNGPAAGDDMIRGQDGAVVGHADGGHEPVA